jgi:formamidopyrimidine-DNA glycosylase
VPELPEVEVVRRGLQAWVEGRTVAAVTVHHPRAVRRHLAGPDDFAVQLVGRTFGAVSRRGKYLWIPLGSDAALTAHLGMSGQLLVVPRDGPGQPHLRVAVRFTDGGPELRFVDQRTFGVMFVEECDEAGLPVSLRHIARDPFDPQFDEAAFFARLRLRRTGVKRALLDQSLISGIGNIYADEALWRARLHGARPTETLRRREAAAVLAAARGVMVEALGHGGTSFDALYVDVNGESGYFDRSLHVYGRTGLPCDRCGTPIRREVFMNRSSFTCPRCQPRPRRARP